MRVMTRQSKDASFSSTTAQAATNSATDVRRTLLRYIEVPKAAREAYSSDAVTFHIETPRIHSHSFRQLGRKVVCSSSSPVHDKIAPTSVRKGSDGSKVAGVELVSRTIVNRKMIRNAVKAGVTLSDSTLNRRQEIRRLRYQAMRFVRDYAMNLKKKYEECVITRATPQTGTGPQCRPATRAEDSKLPPLTARKKLALAEKIARRLSANEGQKDAGLLLNIQPCCGTWNGPEGEKKKRRCTTSVLASAPSSFEANLEMLSFSKPVFK